MVSRQATVWQAIVRGEVSCPAAANRSRRLSIALSAQRVFHVGALIARLRINLGLVALPPDRSLPKCSHAQAHCRYAWSSGSHRQTSIVYRCGEAAEQSKVSGDTTGFQVIARMPSGVCMDQRVLTDRV